MYTVDEQLTKGCDYISRKYCNSYNELAKFLDGLIGQDSSDLNEWDLSAFGLHLCKFFEQEINSSIIQLLRKYKGIEMPTFFCRTAENFKRENARINTRTVYSPHYVWLNDSVDRDNKGILKQIPIGEAYHATMACINEDKYWFQDYPVLKDAKFLEIWRNVHRTRNRIAHSGSVVSREELTAFFESFKVFLDRFMPSLRDIKNALAPKGWDHRPGEPVLSETEAVMTPLPWVLEAWKTITKPSPTVADFEKIESMYKQADELDKEGKDLEGLSVLDEMDRFARQFNWLDIPFEENGHYGLKDFKGEIIVPALYDDFSELHNFMQDYRHQTTDVTIAQKNGKVGFVKRYTGEEITGFDYDSLYNIPYTPYYCYKKDGSKAFGIINKDGVEKTSCIIDNMYEIFTYAGFMIRSGDKYGYYSMYYDFCIPPIYDEIVFTDLDIPLTFIIDGTEGQIDSEGNFYTKEEIERMDEDTLDRLYFIMEYEG